MMKKKNNNRPLQAGESGALWPASRSTRQETDQAECVQARPGWPSYVDWSAAPSSWQVPRERSRTDPVPPCGWPSADRSRQISTWWWGLIAARLIVAGSVFGIAAPTTR